MPRTASTMTARERILAALRRQPVDRIPFVPLIDYYTIKDMPPEVPQNIVGASRALGCDLMVRHVPVSPVDWNAFHLQDNGPFAPPVTVSSKLNGTELIETLSTPIGTLTGTWVFNDAAAWLPHPVQHVVNNREQMEIFHYAVEHLSTEPPARDFETFRQADLAIGPDGIATASLSNSPLMYLIEVVWGLETTYYLLQDERAAVEDILARLHESLKRQAAVLAESPAEVIIAYENTSSTLLSPEVFRRYCLPYLNDYAEIMRAAGKIFLIHMCGKLHAFLPEIARGRFHGIADISPAPTGDLPLDKAASALPGQAVLGGIDATTFINPDARAVEAEVAGLIERIKPYRGVLLGSADTAPRGTPPENFRLIRRLVDSIGAYR